MTTTRSFCPLCAWHHDVDNDHLPAGVTVDVTAAMTMDEMRNATVHAMAMRQLEDAEGIIRAHLETHELIEWVQALQAAKQQLVHEKARQEAYEESVVGALNERNARDARRAGQAEAQVAAVRAYADSLYSAARKIDACGVREKLYELLPMAPAKRVDAGFRWHVLSDCTDEAACPIHGRNEGEPTGPEDKPDPGEVHQQNQGFSGGEAWMWRCNGTQWCDGWISLDLGSEQAARAEYERHARECHGEQPTEKQLHRRRACPGWEYATTEGPRKAWDTQDVPPEGDGWEVNVDAGRDGWERLDYTEEAYWRRRKP